MIYKDSEWISICEFKDGEICFSEEYINIMKPVGGHIRTFASQLISHWDSMTEFKDLLNYFGPDDLDEDVYSGIDGDPMDVRDDIPELWEIRDIPLNGLTTEWHRDILRAKLVTIKLPKNLLLEYVAMATK